VSARVATRIAVALLALAGASRLHAAAAPEPAPRSISYFYDGFKQAVRPITRSLDLAVGVRKLTGNPREAANVDENDQVRLPSTWWTPRVGFQPVSPQDMLAGTGTPDMPAPGTWTIVKAKNQGVSPGFQILDSNGQRWAIKFDPPTLPELTTAADVITSKLYWAAGFNVPHNVITSFRREDLKLKPGLRYKDPLLGEQLITEKTIDLLLARVARRPDSSWRCVASRFLKGKPLGEIDFERRRKDDPEDLIPHELRRELRGMWTVNAWLHHDDCSSRNTLDMLVKEDGRTFVRHHFIDFSGTLGAASVDEHSRRSGHEYMIDYGVAIKNLATVGLVRPKWEHGIDPEITGIGFIDSKTFDPSGWRPFLPNAAFDARTERDIQWGARIIAGFDEALIRAAVHEGKFSDPRAEDYLVKTLLARREKIVERWLAPAKVAGHANAQPSSQR
jgi:hypothetical protein